MVEEHTCSIIEPYRNAVVRFMKFTFLANFKTWDLGVFDLGVENGNSRSEI